MEDADATCDRRLKRGVVKQISLDELEFVTGFLQFLQMRILFVIYNKKKKK